MNTRTRTIASFFSVAMAAMIFGAMLTSQIRRPENAQARPAETVAAPATRSDNAPFTFDTFREIAKAKSPGVVNINAKTVNRRQRFHDDLMERFFGPERDQPQALGSGFIIDKEGHILTNTHVVAGADQIRVRLANEKEYDAKLVGRDIRTDVALLKIDSGGEPLTVLNLGDSDQSHVGEWVMAIGNPFGLEGTVTVGVVSFKGRSVPLSSPQTPIEMIQTDAAINPGNSGGPLLNTQGDVIGINTLIVTRGAAQSAGVGFAVPINAARQILSQLREKGKVVRGYLGVTIGPIGADLAKTYGLKESMGAVVASVADESPAAKAGLQPEDVVVAVDGRKLADANDLTSYISSRAPGTSVRLQILRGDSEKAVNVTLGTFPEEGDVRAVEGGRTGKVGMTLQDLSPRLAQGLNVPSDTRGVVVTDVEPGGAAEDAGLQRYDVILTVNGRPVPSVDALEAEIERARPNGVARLRIRRDRGHEIVVLRLK